MHTHFIQSFPMLLLLILLFFCPPLQHSAAGKDFQELIYNPGELKPIDSQLKVRVGEKAPDFSLPSLTGNTIQLSEFKGKKNVVLSFIPAAWTPVCSDQWPGYNIAEQLFRDHNAVLIGISVDNLPTLHAWTREMGELWFHVVSDFWPHGQVADNFGVLRSDGTAERALFFINTEGIIGAIEISDINNRPPLENIVKKLGEL